MSANSVSCNNEYEAVNHKSEKEIKMLKILEHRVKDVAVL